MRKPIGSRVDLSGGKYYFAWPHSDKAFAEEKMEEVHPGKGKRRVAWCVSPGVMYVSDDQAFYVSKARVFTRK